jgi:hypothetical protein
MARAECIERSGSFLGLHSEKPEKIYIPADSLPDNYFLPKTIGTQYSHPGRSLLKIRIFRDKSRRPDQHKPHQRPAVRADGEALSFEDGSGMIGPMTVMNHGVDTRFRYQVAGLE